MSRLLFYFIYFLLPAFAFSQPNNPATQPALYLNPKWSPDGQAITFTSNYEGSLAIYTIDKTGNNLVRITAAGTDNGLPNWSPDGKSLVYYKTIQDQLKLFSMDLQTHTEIQITKSVTVDYAADWSSRNLVVYNSRENAQALNHDLCISNIDGNSIKKITDSNYDYSGPAWSPDGKQIVCIRTNAMNKSFKETLPEELKQIRNSSEIIIMNPDGSDIRNLSNDTVPNRCPSFSKDGQYVYYMSQSDRGYIISRLQLRDHKQEQLFTPPGTTTNFTISPDGRFIAYSSARNKKYGIYVWDIKAQKETLLAGE